MSELRIVQGNNFGTAISIEAVDATGHAIQDFSLSESTDIRVWYVFAGKEVEVEAWTIEDDHILIPWPKDLRFGTYDLFQDGMFGQTAWRNAMRAQFTIVKYNYEANIPDDVIVLDGIYHITASMALLTNFIVEGIPSETTPLMDGEASVGEEMKYARGDHRHPSDTSKQDEIADLATIRSGAAAGATAYQKPQNGIPASDLARGVIPDVSQFITKSVDDLVNYYLKSETYTKEEVQALIAAINQFHYEVYPTLASVTDPQSNVLYLIGPTGSGTDKYEEYVYTTTWVKIGDTSIDLSGYVTTQALNTALADYSTTSQMQSAISTALASYYTKTETDALLGGKQDTLTFDNVPTENSDNPVKSGGVYDAIEDVDAKLDDYAKIDGAYEGMLAGNAMNLVDTTGTPVLREFVFSKSGGSEQIATGTALIKRLRGNTIVWNQLVNTTFPKSVSYNNSGSQSNIFRELLNFQTNIPLGQTRKVILIYDITIGNNQTIVDNSPSYMYLYQATYSVQDSSKLSFNTSLGAGRKIVKLYIPNYEVTTYTVSLQRLYIAVMAGHIADFTINSFGFIDLTQMFGEGNEPTSVAEFESLFPLNYYEYNAGELLSFSGDSIKTVGFNQWDEEWTNNMFIYANNQEIAVAGRRVSTNYIRVIPAGTYCFSGADMIVLQYDANKQPASSNQSVFYQNVLNGATLTLLNNTQYIKIEQMNQTPADICVNISDPSKNGTYEPYVANTKDISFYKRIKDGQGNTLFPNGLLSAGSVYDEVTENKAIKRVGVVDLGTLNWSKRVSGDNDAGDIFSPSHEDIAKGDSDKVSCQCAKYIAVKGSFYGNLSAGTCNIEKNYSTIQIKDSSFIGVSSNTQIKSALQGIMFYYELAEPIEVDIEEQDLAYQVDGGGTEQLLPENTSTPTTTPARLDVNYGLDAMATLKNLQKNYLAQTDLDRLLTAEGYTYTKTWDATNNQWNFTISGNSNWNGKADKVAIVNHGTSDTTFVLPANTFHRWGEVTNLTLTLGVSGYIDGFVNLYMFEFTSGNTPTTLSLPQTVVWGKAGALTPEANTLYEVNIRGDYATWDAYPLS